METDFDWLAYGYGLASGFALALYWAWRRRKSKRPHLMQPPSTPVSIPPQIHAQVRLMRAEGREIEAIKLVRKVTGCDLKAAKEAVNAFR
jgi:hypothetical protein